jgi:hypothetical protein
MAAKDAGTFWTRYKRLAKKDLPVLVKTGILQPTLSSWRTKKIFPRANEAAAIAAALNTPVEFLVTGKDTGSSTVSPAAMNIALTADTLNADGQKILSLVAESLALKYPAPRKKELRGGKPPPYGGPRCAGPRAAGGNPRHAPTAGTCSTLQTQSEIVRFDCC